MLTDKHGKEVKEGDIISSYRSGTLYKVVLNNGLLGVYEDDEFISLNSVLKNFEIVS